MGVGYLNGQTPTEVSKKYGVARSSVRRHRQHYGQVDDRQNSMEGHKESHQSELAKNQEIKVEDSARTSQQLIDDLGIQDALILSRKDGEWNALNGSGEIVTLRRSSVTYAPNLENNEAIKKIVNDSLKIIRDRNVKYSNDKPTEGYAAIFCLSDAQLGKGNQRGGGTEGTVALLKKAFTSFLESHKDKAETIVIADIGDIIEGFFNFPGQRDQNDLDLVSQIYLAYNILLEFILEAQECAPKIIVSSVPSNHCEVRAGKKDMIGSSDNDFGLMINRMLETAFDGDRQITFIRPSNKYLQLSMNVANTEVAVFHGHNLNNINAHSKWWTNQVFDKAPGWDADILITGHFHTMRIEEVGKNRWIFHCPTSEAGADMFENKAGSIGSRSVLSFCVKDGNWFDISVCR